MTVIIGYFPSSFFERRTCFTANVKWKIGFYTDFFKQDLSREERKAAMQELNKKIMDLLTDEQKTAFEQMKKERPQRKR